MDMSEAFFLCGRVPMSVVVQVRLLTSLSGSWSYAWSVRLALQDLAVASLAAGSEQPRTAPSHPLSPEYRGVAPMHKRTSEPALSARKVGSC